jgi:cell division protease FtsH
MSVYKTPADIANLVREAALIAVRNKKELITMKEITEAMERVEMGIKHKRIFSQEERKKIAYHEAGHAIASYFLQPFHDVFKASIASRGEALGMIVPHPREELHVHTKEELLGNIKSALGSYVAEKLKFGTTTTGVGQDFRQAMWYAYQMVWKYGMGKSAMVGDYSLLEGMRQDYGAFRGVATSSYLSEKTKERLNEETQQILQECLKEVEELLTKESLLLDKFASELLRREELDYDEIEAIFKEFGKARPPV